MTRVVCHTEPLAKYPQNQSAKLLFKNVDFSPFTKAQNDKGPPSLQVDFLLRLRLASHIKKASVAVIQTNSPNFAPTSTPKPDSTLWLQSILAPLLQAV